MHKRNKLTAIFCFLMAMVAHATDSTLIVTDACIAHRATAYGAPVNYDGSGVVLGIIDSGFDFGHAAFLDADGKSRITHVYSMVHHGGSVVVVDGDTLPGCEFSGYQIRNLSSDNRAGSHGTSCLAIAAGSQVGAYGGMAPGAELVVCALGYSYAGSATAVANGVRYITNYAKQQGKRCVISLSFSNSYGPHDGTSMLSKQLEAASRAGVVVCASVGNSAGSKKYIHQAIDGENIKGTWLKAKADTIVGDAMVDTWSRTADVVGVQFALIDPDTKQTVFATPVYTDSAHIAAGEDNAHDPGFSMRLNMLCCGTIDVVARHEENGKFHITSYVDLYVKNGCKRYLCAVLFHGKNGVEHDSWGRADVEFSSLASDDYALEEGSDKGCFNDHVTVNDVISVGNSIARNTVPLTSGGTCHDGSLEIGDIYYTSSYGIDVNGQTHPTITAPGTMVEAAYSTPFIEGGSTFSVRVATTAYNTFTGAINYWGYNTGTSMSAPTVAGVVALWLQANPQLTPAQVKQLVTETAFVDEWTEKKPDHFGAGRINALGGLPAVQFPLEMILATKKYTVDHSYSIADGTLRCVRISADGSVIYAKADRCWVDIVLSAPLSRFDRSLILGSYLKGVRGTLTSKQRPQLLVGENPQIFKMASAVATGDINIDGMLNSSDISALTNGVLGVEYLPLPMGDVNADEVMNASDIGAIVNMLIR